MSQPIYELKADLTGDGTYETDWSTYMKGLQGLGVWRETALDSFSPRNVTLLLDNEDKRFSPKNTAGPYSPNLKRGVAVRLKATVTTPAHANLVDNPSAEADITGWTRVTGDTPARSTAQALYGEASLSQNCTAVQQKLNLQLRAGGRFTVTAGLNYVWKTRVLMVGANADSAWRCRIIWWNSSGTPFAASDGSSLLLEKDSPWKSLLVAVVAPTGAVTATLRVEEIVPSDLTSGTFYVDGSDFYQSDDTTLPYLDGDQPGATWAGTAHQSTSSRGADPQFDLFTGTVRSFAVSRGDVAIMALDCTGFLEDFQTLKINAGPFQKKPAKWIIQRLFDIMTRGQKIDDGAFIIPLNIENFAPEPGALITGVVDAAKTGGGDPDDFAALEGDYVRFFQGDADADGRYFELDLTSRTDNDDAYDLAVWVGTDDDDMDGLTAQIKIEDDVGVIHTENIVLDKTTLIEVRVLDKQFSGAATARRLRFYFPATVTGLLNDWFITGLSFTPSKHRIDRVFNPASGAAQWDSDLEYLDAFNRSALATLEEALRSTGAWFYEDGSGRFFLEDFDQRSPTAVPKLRLTDTPILDGYYVVDPTYEEPATNNYNRIRVASFGDVTLLTQTNRTVWAFEPLPRTYGANRRVLLYANYMSEESEGLVVRRAAIVDALGAGNYDPDTRPLSGQSVGAGNQPYIESRGRAGLIIFQTDTAVGLTLDKLLVTGRAWHRSTSERVFVDRVVSGTEDDEPRELLLETPAQGYKTQLMADLATWATRYGNGLSTVRLELKAMTTELLLECMGRQPGLPVRYRQVTGPGASMADELYYMEGWRLSHEVGGVPRMTLLLEEAA